MDINDFNMKMASNDMSPKVIELQPVLLLRFDQFLRISFDGRIRNISSGGQRLALRHYQKT